eukprot:gnl/MRDRNA2_/MRDRNA2_14484_c0_seq1.p1 gnl/MRDRNA2_/MRDRNA2_14484_c0~~gnl/MRDRNA2_/MRDRNA2_14484_c0_seq1.p1  ORF type:complete len:103 (+),score=27.96 gnl/MRDRNA2_/MRDRNA2_14484_c0_seq1:101-409(+)
MKCVDSLAMGRSRLALAESQANMCGLLFGSGLGAGALLAVGMLRWASGKVDTREADANLVETQEDTKKQKTKGIDIEDLYYFDVEERKAAKITKGEEGGKTN